MIPDVQSRCADEMVKMIRKFGPKSLPWFVRALELSFREEDVRNAFWAHLVGDHRVTLDKKWRAMLTQEALATEGAGVEGASGIQG